MKKMLLLASLLISIVLFGGAVKPFNLGFSGPNGSGVASVQVDTVRILSRTSTYPNSAAVTAGYVKADAYYDVINSGASGEAVRWGYFLKSAPDSVWYSTAANSDYRIRTTVISKEDDVSWQSQTYFGFLWFNCTGLDPGMQIRSAGFVANAGLFATQTINSGGFLAARLDTNSLDYRMLTGSSSGRFSNNDVARFDVTYNKLDAGENTVWLPTMDNRDDRHDFGPRSNNVIGQGTYATGDAIYFDMTDAVQLACDMALYAPTILSRGLLVHVYGFIPESGTASNFDFCAGNYATIGTTGKGNPVFVAEALTRRSNRRWGGIPAPVIAIFDDSYNAHQEYYTVMHNNDVAFDASIYRDGVAGHAWVDSLDRLGVTDMNYIMHSRTHTSLGGLTGASLDSEITRLWLGEQFTAPKDTTLFLDYAWPSGGGTPNTSILAASKLIDFGYRSARGTAINWASAEVAMPHDTWLSWDGYVNLYMIAAPSASLVFETGGVEATTAQIADNLDDLIDLAVTDYAHAPVILYGHNYAIDHITSDNLTTLVDLINARRHSGFMSYSRALDLRLDGMAPIAPGDISEWASAGVYTPVMRGIGADSNKIQTMAAQQDSVYEEDANDNLLQMWIGPK